MTPGPIKKIHALLAAALLASACMWPAAQADGDAVTLALQDGRLSLRARAVPVTVLLRQVAAQAGFELVVFGDLSSDARSWTITDLPVDVAVKRIAQDYGLMLFYDPAGAAGAPRLSTVYVVGAVSAAGEQAFAEPPPRLSADAAMGGGESQLAQDSSDRQARIEVIDQLQGQPDQESVDSLLFSLQYDQDAMVRKRAVAALEALGGEAAILSLENGLGDEDASVRIAVVSALARLGGPEASRALGQIIMGDPDQQVRAAAVNGIARQRDDVARVFLQAAIDDPWPIVSDAARRHLAAFEGEVSDAPQEQEQERTEADAESPGATQ